MQRSAAFTHPRLAAPFLGLLFIFALVMPKLGPELAREVGKFELKSGYRVSDNYKTDAYGVELATSGVTNNAYRFAGEQFDSELGKVFLRARYMNAGTGRFWTGDQYESMKADPVSLHKYSYAINDPVQFTDPSGLYSISELGITNSIQSVVSSLQMKIGFGFLTAAQSNGDSSAVTRDLVLGAVFDLAPVIGPLLGKGLSLAGKLFGKTAGQVSKARWLQVHEAAGGHLIAEHVGKDVSALASRLLSTRLTRTSTFMSLEEAERFSAQTLSRNSDEIWQWVKNTDATERLRVYADFAETTGMSLTRAIGQAEPVQRVLLVLEKVGDKVRILTGYPVP